MQDRFDAAEVFRIAEQIERDGAAFYRQAADRFADSDIGGLLAKLASWELLHERIFADMRKLLEAQQPSSDTEKCRSMASLSEFTIRDAWRHGAARLGSIPELIELATKLERDSIIFYEGLKGFAANKSAVEQIDRIIGEEHLHIKSLREML